MRPTKKVQRDLDKIKSLLLKSGIDTDTIEEAIETAPTEREAISRQGEAVLLFLETPAKFTAKVCKRCGEPFGTNYRSVSYCTDSCRSKAISEQLGVKWDWLKPEEERWGGKEAPLIIPKEFMQKFVAWYDSVKAQTQSQTQTLM